MTLYEAAAMDGASSWRRCGTSRCPASASVIVLLLILRLATTLNTGFEQMFLQRNAVGAQAAEVLDTFTYFRGIQGGDWGFSAAVGLVKGVVVAALRCSRPTGSPRGSATRARSDGHSGRHRRGMRAHRPPPWMEKPGQSARVAKATLMIVLAFVMLFPFVYVIAVSFSSYRGRDRRGLILFPKHPTLDAYQHRLRGRHRHPRAAGQRRPHAGRHADQHVPDGDDGLRPDAAQRPGSRFVLTLVLFTLLFTAGIIPNYLLVKQLGMINSLASH